jgi:hypothetical protein
MWCTYALEYYPAMKKNEIMLFIGKWKELEVIMLEGQRLYVFPHMWKPELKDKCIHEYIYDLTNIYTYMYVCIHIQRERASESMTETEGLSEGTMKRWERKRE